MAVFGNLFKSFILYNKYIESKRNLKEKLIIKIMRFVSLNSLLALSTISIHCTAQASFEKFGNSPKVRHELNNRE
jgi:hypothetical protein